MDFGTIGRADPVGTIQNWQKNESILKTQQQNRAVTDLNMEAKKQEIESTQRRMDVGVEQEKEKLKEVPWEVLTTGFETGEGSPGALLTETATKAGLLDMSTGVATINGKRKEALGKLMSSPPMIAKLNRVTVNHSQAQYNKAKEELAKKPDDPNLQAAFQKATTYYTQSVNNSKIFDTKMKGVSEARKRYEYLDAAEQKFIDQGESPVDAKRLAIESLERTKKAGKVDTGGADSGKRKDLESIKSDFQQSLGRYMSSKRGTDQFLPSGDQEAVTKEALQQSAVLARQYQESGGTLKELGWTEEQLSKIEAGFGGADSGDGYSELPDPAEFAGRDVEDTETGETYRSDGKTWTKL